MSRTESPVYLQLCDRIRAWIESGKLANEQKLPSERELSERFQTTRVTVRQALAQLEADGCIFRSNRRGWYLTPARLRYDPSQDLGFNHCVTEQGYTPHTETLSRQLIEAPTWLGELSGLGPGGPGVPCFSPPLHQPAGGAGRAQLHQSRPLSGAAVGANRTLPLGSAQGGVRPAS